MREWIDGLDALAVSDALQHLASSPVSNEDLEPAHYIRFHSLDPGIAVEIGTKRDVESILEVGRDRLDTLWSIGVREHHGFGRDGRMDSHHEQARRR